MQAVATDPAAAASLTVTSRHHRGSATVAAELPPDAFRQALDQLIMENLKPLSVMLAAATFMLFLFNSLIAKPSGLLPVLHLDLATLALAVTLRWLLASGRAPVRLAQPLASLVCLWVFSHTFVVYLLTSSSVYQGYALIIIAGMGFFILAPRWLALAMGLALTAWLPLLIAYGGSDLPHRIIGVAAAATLAWLLHWTRRKNQRHLRTALERLRWREAHYRSVVEDQTEFIVRWKPDGTRTFVNEAYCRYVKSPREELIGSSFFPVLEEESLQPGRERLESLTPEHPVSIGTHLGRTPDGATRWHEWTDRGFFDEQGALVEVHSVGRDVHDKKLTEIALRAVIQGTSATLGDHFFRSVAEQLAVATGVRYALVGRLLSPDGERIQTLAVWDGAQIGENIEYDLAGTPCQSVIERSTCLFPERVQELFPRDLLLGEMGVESYLGTPLLGSSGQPLGVLSVMDPRPIPADSSALACSLLDIFAGRVAAELERLDMEAALRASERQHRELVEEINEVIYSIDAEGAIEYISPPVESLLGYSPLELIGHNFLEMVHEQDQERIQEALKRGLEYGVEPAEYRIVNKSGEYRWIRASGRPISNGSVRGLRGTLMDVTARRESEEALQDSETRFRALFESSPDAIFVEDFDGRILDVNPAACRLLETRRANLIGRHAERLIPSDDKEAARRAIGRLTEGKVAQHEELRLTATGRRLPVSLTCSRFEFSGRPALLFHVRDISWRRRAEQALRESQLRLQRFFDAAEDAIVFHRDGTILDANEKLARMIGMPLSEIIGKQVTEFVATQERHLVHEAIEIGQPGTYEVTGITRGGTKLPLEIIARTLSEDGATISVISVRDLSERRRRQQALRDSEQRYHSLFEDSRDAIVLSTAGGTIEDANTAAVQLLGFQSKEELLRTNARDLYKDQADRGRLFELLAEQGYVKDYEVTFMHREGEELIVLETATAVRDEQGRVVSCRALIRDVTRQRALEKHLRHAQKMEAVGRLAGGVAHDFNNLLTAITGYSELCLSQAEAESPVHGHLCHIREAANRAEVLTRQLLAFSRQQVLRPMVLNLSALTRDFEDLLRRTIGEHIELETKLESAPWNVKADPGQIDQVLMNLVVNARDAMPDGGRIVLETGNVVLNGDEIGEVALKPGHYVLLAVTDTGCGMDSEIRRRVFEPFFTTKEEGRGTGLGMATVYGIIKQSGGYISVHSEPGEGTTVKVYLPRVLEELRPAATESRRDLATTESKTILLAEDNPIVRNLVTRVLEELGHRVLAAESPAEALQVSAKHDGRLDLLLTDLVMPQMSGLELAEQIAVQRPDTRVLVMSGYSKEAKFRPNPLASRAAFIQKPFTPEALQEMVSIALDQQLPPREASGEAS